ncbi:histidine--tRNA ligase [Salisediminibacterium halotolerans]|uniref:Histidine--tRNA ligase n=1 Tax=Salisediminibacterium halotolerans TaxID=517425 RepID=A0A1H9VCF9_9BACI|nr:MULTISPECIES: histidine--tRNA ligase [Salisediminibacterium]RLJ78377.1 histidyl-tRNA synthetase [Actinophytocola xinjiangensis]RPE88281.1 histidyl-tRNA synthetase [Salisediminibacterium halotolerans]TWG37353.1 histidyl-tRNA synthetase [Salisediminibacterium halotolerans]SES18907.1 histidyl-tRNA synthetase [Salisediminibacterium haloalkalitolerans]GEL06818.1 histidine--tRNA ligase 2 [Salisediminibacterium halotolerans]
MNITIPRGTQDILPGESAKWQYIEAKAHDLCRRYNYQEIRTPIFEQTELFSRSVGDTTDIVQKEMYTFEDRGGRNLTLRPEGTASTVRSFVDEKMHGWANQPVKLYYIGPMFRYERPQSGRMRQFVQFGVEAMGSADPAVDAEVIGLAMDFYKELGLKGLKLVINSLGDKESRTAHRNALVNHFKPRIGEFCSDCQERLEKNPLRILDCKQDAEHELMASAPSILDYLNAESRQYFEDVKTFLTAMDIPYEVDPGLVRGLDYYNNTAFEIMIDGEGFGAITTLMGGGRYNGLVEEIGGPETPGIGFALSIERLLMALDSQGVTLPVETGLDAYLVTMGDEAKKAGPRILHELRAAGLSVDGDYMGKKMKAQMKSASRQNAAYAVILGEEELAKGTAVVKKMADGTQEEWTLEELAANLKKHLEKEKGVSR